MLLIPAVRFYLSGTGAGLEVYGRFARDFDFDLYRRAASKEPVDTHASLPTRPHCDAGSRAPVLIDASTGARTALFPGGITQRAAPDFAAVVSRLAASASSPGEVAASALKAQALQTGMVQLLVVVTSRCVLQAACPCVFLAGTREDHGFCCCARGAFCCGLFFPAPTCAAIPVDARRCCVCCRCRQ